MSPGAASSNAEPFLVYTDRSSVCVDRAAVSTPIIFDVDPIGEM
jgi:hypothetical protein